MGKHRLVLYVHGSEDPRWRRPFEELTRELQKEAGTDRVALAYMEFVRPSLIDVAEAAARDGVENLSVLPLFMAAGAHLANDLPEQVAVVRAELSHLRLKVLPPVGEDPRMAALLRLIAREVLAQESY